ncbi:MAG: hypothetical protein FWB93_05415 [Oscillospiraceae bacterium]|nr:hypothetical protein [Oscillospiraceae bacterium]
MKTKTFKLLPIPSEDYDALGITPNSTVETYIDHNGALVIRVVSNENLEDFECNGKCDCCPMQEISSCKNNEISIDN